jgi:carbamoyl-phosphate synthase/aspartate carbamoyltransferase
MASPIGTNQIGTNEDFISQGRLARLELEDGSTYQGFSFGAEKSVAGELVFQTGIAIARLWKP